MFRSIAPLCGILAGALVLAPSALAGQHLGGCALQGKADFDGAGLGVNAPSGPGALGPAFTYAFDGTLSSCNDSDGTIRGVENLASVLIPDPGLGNATPAAGAVSTGRRISIDGVTVQEPKASGDGGCTASETSGTAIVQWDDGTVTVIGYSTDGALAGVGLQGTVLPAVTLPVVDPATGAPVLDPQTQAPITHTVTTTRDGGDQAGGALAFQPASPTDCQTGVKTATISGIIGTGNDQ